MLNKNLFFGFLIVFLLPMDEVFSHIKMLIEQMEYFSSTHNNTVDSSQYSKVNLSGENTEDAIYELMRIYENN
ncbi:hypothetical protein J8L73_16675 [Pseudoalteromonas sp. MMG006]|uniref:hypothetical protein n=1 Tax=Pseudoalteromonas sp. MMG006 TaxID=2822683 RepID=UPI001B38B11A|nr:hypothetical protein [Pseudoalteromonas sp. MMG006]MBQ4800738.1 hypothetical protein [Pseudoalteromonas sp. MMG006]